MIQTKGYEKPSPIQIYEFLKLVDKDFPVPLSEKTDLKEYADKLYNRGTVFTYEDKGRILAMVAGYIENSVDNLAYLAVLAALPETRGQGISKKLVTKFIEKSKEKELKAVHLYAVRENIPAMNLYKGLGFEELHLENESRPNDVHFIYYLNK